jgi:ribulose kinase
MQILADVTGREINVNSNDQACALGSAYMLAVWAGNILLFTMHRKRCVFVNARHTSAM